MSDSYFRKALLRLRDEVISWDGGGPTGPLFDALKEANECLSSETISKAVPPEDLPTEVTHCIPAGLAMTDIVAMVEAKFFRLVPDSIRRSIEQRIATAINSIHGPAATIATEVALFVCACGHDRRVHVDADGAATDCLCPRYEPQHELEERTTQATPCVAADGCTDDSAGEYSLCPVHLALLIDAAKAHQSESVPIAPRSATSDLRELLQDVVDETIGYRPEMDAEALLAFVRTELGKKIRLTAVAEAARHMWESNDDGHRCASGDECCSCELRDALAELKSAPRSVAPCPTEATPDREDAEWYAQIDEIASLRMWGGRLEDAIRNFLYVQDKGIEACGPDKDGSMLPADWADAYSGLRSALSASLPATPSKPAKTVPVTDGELSVRLLARIDSLTAGAEEAFEVADDRSQSEDIRERMRAKGHRLKSLAHELGRLLAPIRRRGPESESKGDEDIPASDNKVVSPKKKLRGVKKS